MRRLFSFLFGTPAPHTGPDTEKDVQRKAWKFVRYIIWAGILFILAISVSGGSSNNSFGNFLSTYGRALLVGAAAFGCGGFGGFIFGIPSMVQNEETQKQLRLKYNDNLIQISDWLTKIIVGVGLIQLTKIPDKISELGDNLKTNFGSADWAKMASLSIVFYFFLFGFLIVYFWTRTDFTKIIVKTNDDLDKIQALQVTVQNQNATLESQKQKIETLLDSETAKRNKEMIGQSQEAFDASTAKEIDGKDPKMKEAALELEAKVKEVLNTKRQGTDPDDLQKNRWGGNAEAGNKKISAIVTADKTGSFYDVTFTIEDKNGPLTSPVALFVHDSFELDDNVIYLKPNSSGKAQVTLTAYEAFTAGALFPDGTELELDLNQQTGYPDGFYWGKNNPPSSSTAM